MIQVRGLTKVFPNGLKAVDNLDLTVPQGEILGLLGPNGAGKTTTIRALTTLCGFDSGKVLVAGHDVDREPEMVRQSIGVVAQNTGIDYFLTGRENLELQGHLYRMKKSEINTRISELAQYFDLESDLDRQVAMYSGGMRRKLDIATALIHRPSLLFLDEPTLGLDIKSRKMLWEYIQKLNQDTGLTILLTTHYLEEANKLAHRVAIISNGKIRALGTPDELKGKIAGDALTLVLERNKEVDLFVSALTRMDYVKDSKWESNKLHLYVTNGAESVPKISSLANKHSIHIFNLSLSRPSLDDVFLKYTGNTIEDSSEETGEEWWKQWAGKGSGKWQQQWKEDSDSQGSGQSDSKWSDEQWPQTSDTNSNSTDQSISADDSGDTQSQQRWSTKDMEYWHNQNRANTDEGWRDKNETSANNKQDKPEQQDWLRAGADDKSAKERERPNKPIVK